MCSCVQTLLPSIELATDGDESAERAVGKKNTYPSHAACVASVRNYLVKRLLTVVVT
jgi:hypothetical protein